MPPSNLSDALAVERTFLAWIRTGLALSGFGFVIARFGLFLRAMGLEHGNASLVPLGAPWFGAILILAGAISFTWSAWTYGRLLHELARAADTSPHRSYFATGLALLLAILGVALAIHVFLVNPAVAQPAQEKSMVSQNGVVTIASHHPVAESVERLERILAGKGVKLFAVIDHSGEAEKAGFEMRPCKLLIFGNPKAGTPLMLASPSAALDLPLKILVWENAEGGVSVSYNDAAYLQQRHGLPESLMSNIAVVSAIAEKVAGEA